MGEEETLQEKLLRWSKKGLELSRKDPDGPEAKLVEKSLEENLEHVVQTSQELGFPTPDKKTKSD